MTRTEIWTERVVAWRASGQSAAKFCEGKEFSEGSLYRWASRLDGPPAEASAHPRIARVVRSFELPTSAGGGTAPALTVEMDGARIVVPSGMSPATLALVLEALEKRAQRSAR